MFFYGTHSGNSLKSSIFCSSCDDGVGQKDIQEPSDKFACCFYGYQTFAILDINLATTNLFADGVYNQ